MLYPATLLSQHIGEKLSLGARVGPNLWVNDMSDRRVGFGGEASARYGMEHFFSLGASLGYEVLKAGQFPLEPEIPIDYLRSSHFTFAIGVWLHFAPGNRFSPYFNIGLGMSSYSRQDGTGLDYPPGDNSSSSLYMPISFGFEVFVSRNASVTFDLGYRLLDQNTEGVSSGNADGFSAARFGACFYFGSNGKDDNDNDGVSNEVEDRLFLDPENSDSDADGLTDGEEYLKYKTDPAKVDTDGDGLKDGDELWRFRTDPLKADSDKDGLSDGDEVSKYNTDPLKLDTDKDGLSDGEELVSYNTDPLKQDTDGDGLLDPNELYGYKTNPLIADSDSGSVDDGAEVKRGSNPLRREDDIIAEKKEQIKDEIGLLSYGEGIRFKPNSSSFLEGSDVVLERALEAFSRRTDFPIEIRGYTDDRGSRASNIRLSRDRALAVKRWLIQRGIAEDRLTAKGLGPENPIAPNTDEEGRIKNRRIEFYRTK